MSKEPAGPTGEEREELIFRTVEEGSSSLQAREEYGLQVGKTGTSGDASGGELCAVG